MREIPELDVYLPSSLGDALEYPAGEGREDFVIAGCTNETSKLL